jgi:hypothetical protein
MQEPGLVDTQIQGLYNIYSLILRSFTLLTCSSAIFLGLTAFLCFFTSHLIQGGSVNYYKIPPSFH